MAAQIAGRTEFIQWNDKMYGMIGREIDRVKEEGCQVVIMGDLNGHCGNNFKGTMQGNSNKQNSNGKKIMELIISKGLECENDNEKEGKVWTWTGYRGRMTINSCLDYCLSHGLTTT